jgi:hypothetical protein
MLLKTEWGAGVIYDKSDTAIITGAQPFFGKASMHVDEDHLVRIVITLPNSQRLGLTQSHKVQPGKSMLCSSGVIKLTADAFATEVTRRRKDGDDPAAVCVRLIEPRGVADRNG